jgi:hypothetical protein
MTQLIALTLTIGAIAVVWNLFAVATWKQRALTSGTPSDAGLHLLVAVAIAGGLLLVVASLHG